MAQISAGYAGYHLFIFIIFFHCFLKEIAVVVFKNNWAQFAITAHCNQHPTSYCDTFIKWTQKTLRSWRGQYWRGLEEAEAIFHSESLNILYKKWIMIFIVNDISCNKTQMRRNGLPLNSELRSISIWKFYIPEYKFSFTKSNHHSLDNFATNSIIMKFVYIHQMVCFLITSSRKLLHVRLTSKSIRIQELKKKLSYVMKNVQFFCATLLNIK